MYILDISDWTETKQLRLGALGLGFIQKNKRSENS